MHGRPIRTSLGSEQYESALVCTGPKVAPLVNRTGHSIVV